MGPALDILLLGLGLGSNMDFCGDFGPAPRKQRSGRTPFSRMLQRVRRQKCCVGEL